MLYFKVPNISKAQGFSAATDTVQCMGYWRVRISSVQKTFHVSNHTMGTHSFISQKNHQKVQAVNFVFSWEITYKIAGVSQRQFISVHTDHFPSVYYFDSELCGAGSVYAYLTLLTCLIFTDWMSKTKPLKFFLMLQRRKFWMTFKQHYQFLSNICIQIKKCSRSMI